MCRGDVITVYKRQTNPQKKEGIKLETSSVPISATVLEEYVDGSYDVSIGGKLYSVDKNKFVY